MVERSPEKAGVGGSIPSLATMILNNLAKSGSNGAAKSPTIDHPRLLDELLSGFLVQAHGFDLFALGFHALFHARVRVHLEQD